MAELVEVQFKGNRRECFTWDNQHPLAPGDSVIVELERGRDLGCITAVGEKVAKKCSASCGGDSKTITEKCSRKILRTASEEDRHLHEELRKGEREVKKAVVERVKHHGLVMKVCDAEWQWDRKKLTVYFTAEARVDFRALVRDLAGLFRTRIELRQIGARDEAKRLDGVGRCGQCLARGEWGVCFHAAPRFHTNVQEQRRAIEYIAEIQLHGEQSFGDSYVALRDGTAHRTAAAQGVEQFELEVVGAVGGRAAVGQLALVGEAGSQGGVERARRGTATRHQNDEQNREHSES